MTPELTVNPSTSQSTALSTLSFGKEPTMSSREIAELCDKEHRNVMRDIRDMVVQLHPTDVLKFEHIYRDAKNRQQVEYLLPKRETLILVSGYRLDLRAKIIDRWQELEERDRTRDPMEALNDPATMRGLLLTYSERMLALETQNAELQEKGVALDRIADADGSFCITDAAKTLQARPKDLFGFLRSHGWIYSRPGTVESIAYQSKLAAGLLEHKTTTVHRSDGSEKVTTQVRVTPKGLARLAQEFQPAVRLI
jgi:phage antirepressor YoqD-like protein/phage regulator Rha-like protein